MGRRAKPTSSSRAASRSPSYADAPSLRASPAGSTPSTEGGARLRLAGRRGAAAVRLPPFLGRELLGCRRGTTAAGQLLSFFRRELLVLLPLLLDLLPLLGRQLFYRFV